MIINHNIGAMNTSRQLGISNNFAARSMEKLSSGFRINKAGDDAAGLSISEKMRAQIRGLNQASRNAQDGISLVQTAEGALNETHSILQRMRELAVQAGNDTMTTVDRISLQEEMDQLASEITRIANTTEFNTKNLMSGKFGTVKLVSTVSATGTAMSGKLNVTVTMADGSTSVTTASGTTVTNATKVNQTQSDSTSSLVFQIGANTNQVIRVNINAMTATSLGVVATTANGAAGTAGRNGATVQGISISSQTNAAKAISIINNAINLVSKERSKLGAVQNRLEHTIANLDTAAENLQASESRIRDVDMAKEIMELSKQNILSQAGNAMLAQANQKPQSVLQLLG
jgi:flagellin